MRSCVEVLSDPDDVSPVRRNLVTYLFRLGELQAMVDKLFDFARNMGEFDSSLLQWSDFQNSFSVLGVWPQDIAIDDDTNLESFTRRRIASGLDFNA